MLQEKFADYKTAVDELSLQLQNLEAEKDALAADKAILESCLQVSYQRGLPVRQEAPDLNTSSSEAYQVFLCGVFVADIFASRQRSCLKALNSLCGGLLALLDFSMQLQ